MQLLDATLAMVLTLAALATIVTIFMEAGLRAARMRKKNLIELIWPTQYFWIIFKIVNKGDLPFIFCFNQMQCGD